MPLANGIVSGNWIWKTFIKEQYDIFFIDAFWLVLSSLTLGVGVGLKRKEIGGSHHTGVSIKEHELKKEVAI